MRWAAGWRRPIGRAVKKITAGDRGGRLSFFERRPGDRQEHAIPDAEGGQGTNMIITKKTLSRRTVLRGIGACLALPMLDSMTPALAAAVAGQKPVRTMFIYAPNGMVMADWTPRRRARLRDDAHPQAFEPFRNDMFVLTGMMDHNGNALGDGGGDHARAGGSFLTGVHPAKTAGKDIKVGISVDQVAANAIGSATRLRSLELGCEDSRTVGNCDSGYSCAYTNSLSWRGPSTPNPPGDQSPRRVRAALRRRRHHAAARSARQAPGRSQEHPRFGAGAGARDLGHLGGADRRKMDEYLTAVREIEMQIQAAEKKKAVEVSPDFERPDGVPFEYAAYAKIMLDLAAMAFQADITRVVTIVLGREGSLRTYNEIGVPDGHHPLSHHGNRPEWLAKLSKINQFHTQIFAQFIGQDEGDEDGDGTSARPQPADVRQRPERQQPAPAREPADSAVRPRQRQDQARPPHRAREADAHDQPVSDDARPDGHPDRSVRRQYRAARSAQLVVRCMTIRLLVFLLAVACAPQAASAQSSTSFDAVAPAMQAFVGRGEVAGVVTLLATKDTVIHLGAVGHSDVGAGRKMKTDDIFWIASMSKPVTAVAVALLVDDGKLSFDDPVPKHLPEFREHAAAITLRDLLTHTSGLGELNKRVPHLTLAETSRQIAAMPLRFEPRTRWGYSTRDWTYWAGLSRSAAA